MSFVTTEKYGVNSMGGKIYTESTIEEALDRAAKELCIPKESLEYTVIEEKRGFFKKSVSIEVRIEEKVYPESGTVKVEKGRLMIRNPEIGGRPASIEPSEHMKLFIDGEEVWTAHEVFEENLIEIKFDEAEAKRLLNITVSPDKMTAYISISYIPEITYTLKDSEEINFLFLKGIKKEKKFPPLFNTSEIKAELQKVGICSGIIDESLENSSKEREIKNLLVARGIPVVDDIDDKLEIKFNESKNTSQIVEDSIGKVDFRNLYSIDEVKKGDILAIKVAGAEGRDGKDIYGNVVRKKNRGQISLRAGTGAVLQDENTVAAAIDGKPCIKNSVFYVYQVHEVSNDVDLVTGNINFIGDVKIYGSVREGMKVEAGNGVQIGQDVEHANISAKGDIIIKGNVITSRIACGGEDITIQRLGANLNELRLTLISMMDAITEIKKFNLLGEKITDGEMIRILIENKFRTIPKICMCIIRDTLLHQGNQTDEVVNIIKQKLIGMAAISIHHFGELDGIVEAIDCRIKELENVLSLPVNINIAYCQDSEITSSGDIFVTGKGVYVSKLTAHNGVYFLDERAVARGGIIKAKNEIKSRKVGSTGGVSTKLWVEEKGHIWADIAFQNTNFTVGLKEYILEKPSKNVHAYIDETGDLVVEKLHL